MRPKQKIKVRKKRVTFTMPAINDCCCLYLVGRFDEWNHESVYRMQPAKDGSWSLVLELETGHQYQYRYRTDKGDWYADPFAKGYTPNYDGSRNSEVRV